MIDGVDEWDSLLIVVSEVGLRVSIFFKVCKTLLTSWVILSNI